MANRNEHNANIDWHGHTRTAGNHSAIKRCAKESSSSSSSDGYSTSYRRALRYCSLRAVALGAAELREVGGVLLGVVAAVLAGERANDERFVPQLAGGVDSFDSLGAAAGDGRARALSAS